MGSFRFHLVTVIGIFLALALGIFIGSTTSEEPIIRQQREVIERLEKNNHTLGQKIQQLEQQVEEQELMLAAHRQLTDIFSEVYWHSNPVEAQAMLVHGPGFSPQILGSYLLDNVIGSMVAVAGEEVEIEALTMAIASGNFSDIPLNISGRAAVPDLVLVALGPRDQYGELLQPLLSTLTGREIPVVVLGKRDWGTLSDLSPHPLVASVAHIDTPLGLFCLGEILRGNLGHFGPEQLLPGWER